MPVAPKFKGLKRVVEGPEGPNFHILHLGGGEGGSSDPILGNYRVHRFLSRKFPITIRLLILKFLDNCCDLGFFDNSLLFSIPTPMDRTEQKR